MRLTAEIRWFWAGAPPSAFQEWFTSAGPNSPAVAEGQARTDEYLRENAHCTLGIKKRGGQAGVEIKGQIAPGKTILEHAGCTAPVELWAKWSSRTLKIDGGALIRVQKRRWMRKFRVSSGQAAECTGSDQTRTSGCDAELTLIEVKGSAWWTFGFEAFGELERIQDDLAATVALLASRLGCPVAKPARTRAGLPRG